MIMAFIYHYDPQIFSQMKEMLSTLYKAIMNYKANYSNNLPNHLDTTNKISNLTNKLHHIINTFKQ
jgi:hypothetical protein